MGAGGRKRAAVTPNVPSVLETGYPTLVTETTSGLYGPKGMPLALRERIAADVIAAASDPAVVEKIVASGQDMNTGGPAELTATLKQQGDALARGREDPRHGAEAVARRQPRKAKRGPKAALFHSRYGPAQP